jgi:predicted transcriptional regulator
MTGQEKLSRRERQIMQAVYAQGSLTIKELSGLISDPPSDTALRTTLGILVKKGWLTSQSIGRQKAYSATKSKASVSRVELRNIMQAFFGGSIEQLLASHFADPDCQIDEETFERLQSLIEKNMNDDGKDESSD